MKKRDCFVLTALLVGTSLLPMNVYAAPSYEAKKSTATVQVDQVPRAFEAYTVNDNNYFKLRDIAFILNNTEKEFSVEWQKEDNAVVLKTGKPYASVGTEMGVSSSQATQTAIPTASKIKLDGETVDVTAYLINGNNYLKLRDLGEVINFGVDWNDDTNTVEISSKKGYGDEIGVSPIKPWEYQKMLGKGMDVDWSKTEQGKEAYNTKAVKDFKKAGVSHVRIRVKDKADAELFKYLDKQIEDCLENGLIPVIAYQADEFKNEPSQKNIEKVAEWWHTVAERYKDKSYLLSFDLLIEATDALNKQPEKLNEIYETVVSRIREVSPNRIIMISPRLRSDSQYLDELKIPTQHNGYLMAEWHFYAAGPSKDNERKLWTTGTAEEKKLITEKIDYALAWQKKTGVPTWVGAWMPGNYNDGDDYSVEEQVEFAKYMTKQLEKAEIPFAVNSDTKFYDREKGVWIEEMSPVFDAIYQ
ncbi:cellulase family glycosylhydrolase [Anaerotignum sp.]|uniref:cellulase family glycosylhydrolase n=1 Tax=Anaerotignum sp. TaxID=2039241 RepID=UPI0028B00E6B|nr:cellulase family glycosylhydrolase [Anaerotignum sp.]